jgi:hypothetical protein
LPSQMVAYAAKAERPQSNCQSSFESRKRTKDLPAG